MLRVRVVTTRAADWRFWRLPRWGFEGESSYLWVQTPVNCG